MAHDPEKSREYNRRHYARHREAEIARCAAYAKNNKTSVNQRSVEWRSQRRAPNVVLYWNARNRAKAKGILFDLCLTDIVVPEFCPVLGIRLVIGTGCAKPNSPSLDRIDSEKGYVRGNISVISHKANTIKSNATLADLEAVISYVRRHL